jgi:hypothetical protein
MSPQELVAIHEITQLKYRYVRAVDTQDWELLASVLTQNARTWYDKGALAASGRENIVAMLSASLKPSVYTSHIALHPEITVTSPTAAKGTWRFEDVVHFTEADPTLFAKDLRGDERLTGAGYYYDEYEKEDDQWKIASTGYVRIFEVTEHLRDQPNVKARFETAHGRLNK